ncbi:MAG: cytochrome c-type biogenesis protein [Pseudomonadota bacterium]
MIRVVIVWLALVAPAWSLGIEDVMADPALDARAQALYHDLRCVRCRSESIASSNADWAQDARAAVRERLTAGDSDAEVLAFFRARFGDYVLMDPPKTGYNAILWFAAPAFLVAGLAGAVALIRRRRQMPDAPPPLTAEEEARLKTLLDDPPPAAR